jgi:polar amino acid transport system permease protein
VIAIPLSTLVAILAVTGPKWLKDIIKFYTSMFRGSPLLLQLYLAYFGLPFIGIILPANLVIVGVFVLCISAYESEVVRGGIISIEKGQYEACQVLGMSKAQTMWRVVIPQTVRKVLPPTCSQAIVLFKDTSLVAAIGVGDLLRSATALVISDMRIDSFVVVLVIYLAVSSIMVISFDKLEKKYSVYV